MVLFDYRRIIKIREMSFGTVEDSVQNDCDVVYLHSNDEQNRAKEIKRRSMTHEQYTLVNDLTKNEEDLFSGFNKNYKNEIRRALREGGAAHICDTKDENMLAEFQLIFNHMFAAKGMRNKFNLSLVKAGLWSGYIIISKGYYPEVEGCIVYHAYLADGESAMLMYSASTLNEQTQKEDANKIGRMNKYLHWYDLKWFKEQGYSRYEWGGINSVENPSGIAKFKMGFGGEVKKYMNYITANSPLGILYMMAVKAKSKQWK